MKKNKNKYTLLDKNESGDIEMIEMNEYSHSNSKPNNTGDPSNDYVMF